MNHGQKSCALIARSTDSSAGRHLPNRGYLLGYRVLTDEQHIRSFNQSAMGEGAMKSFLKAVVVGLLLIGPSEVGWGKPIKPKPGETWCGCSCINAETSTGKFLEYRTGTGTCSPGKECKFTKDGGKTYTQGKLGPCEQCTGTSAGGWNCKFVYLKSPSGTLQLQPVTPQAQPPAATMPPSKNTLQ